MIKRRSKKQQHDDTLREPVRYDPTKTGLERWFGSGEARVMAYLWQQTEPVTIKRVQEALTATADAARAYTTYATLLNRLERKGLLVKRRRSDGLFEYETRESQDTWEGNMIGRVLNSIYLHNETRLRQWLGQSVGGSYDNPD